MARKQFNSRKTRLTLHDSSAFEKMNIELRPIEAAEAAELAKLSSDSFDDYERSQLLAEIVEAESATRPANFVQDLPSSFGIAAFRAEVLVGWSQGFRKGKSEFYMLNSGVAEVERRKGVYTSLVEAILVHASSAGYSKVTSHHAARNSAVIIAKLKLGFHVSGYEYSEVYGHWFNSRSI